MESVAVIMSVYRSDCLDDLIVAINSILKQTYSRCDLFVYRDGPVEKEVEEYLQSLNIKESSFYYYPCSENKGLANALNFLIDRVLESKKYNYVARMDSDDISRKERIEKQVLFMNNNSHVDVCGTSCHEFGASFSLDEKHLPKGHDQLVEFSITRCPFIHPTVMFRSSVFEKGHRYPTNTSLTEDMALWFQLLKSGCVFANLNDVLLDYRLNENTINRRHGIGKAFSEIRIRFSYMISLKKVSFKNAFLIISRLVFHLLPSKLMKLAYLKAR